jgi:predicted MFS family arabinose efflux permease
MLSPLLRPIAKTFGLSEAVAGQAGTIGAVAAVVASISAARWMDRVSRRAWLSGQSVALLVSTAVIALAPSFGWLLLGRALAGLGGAVVLANCLAATGELFPDRARRDWAIGIIVSATTVAVVVGLPALALIEERAGWRWAVAAIEIPLLVLLLGSRWLPGTVPTAHPPPHRLASTRVLDMLRDGPILFLLGAATLFILPYMGWLTYFGAYVESDFGAGAATLSALFLSAGLAELVANTGTPLLLRRVSPRSVFVVFGLVFAANLVLTGIVYIQLWTVFVATSITSACAAILYIAINGLLLDARPTARGSIMALSSAATGIGSALGPLTGGAALSTLGNYAGTYQALGLIAPFAVVCLALSSRLSRAAPHQSTVAEVPPVDRPGSAGSHVDGGEADTTAAPTLVPSSGDSRSAEHAAGRGDRVRG